MIPSLGYSSFDLFGFQLQTHGLFAALGLLAWFCSSLLLARRRGLDLYPLLVSIPLSALAGAVTGHQFFLLASPLNSAASSGVLDLWAGQSMQGVIVGGAAGICVALIITIRTAYPIASNSARWSLFSVYADTVVAMLPIGIALARIGCFLIHEKPGSQTTFPLGVVGGCPSGDKATACHDLAFYEIAASLLFMAFTYLHLTRNVYAWVAPLFLIYYGLFRAFVSLLENRYPPSISLVGQAYLAAAALGLVIQLIIARIAAQRLVYRPPT